MRRLALLGCLFVAIILTTGVVSGEEAKTGVISGQMMLKDGGPMTGGIVSLFNETSGPPPDPERYWRVPDHIVKLDNNGRFTAEVVEGHYYIGAIKRKDGLVDSGPPQEGDYLFASQDEKATPKSYVVKAGRSVDIGVISGVAPLKASGKPLKEISAVEGMVADAEGKPVKGALVYAFRTASEVGKPVFISDYKTGADGKYVLRVAGDIKYYLKVREVYGGGPPFAGEAIGGYGEKEPIAISVKKGETLKGINIKITKFPGRGPQKKD